MKEEMRKWKGTCSIENPKEGCVSFARTREYLSKARGIKALFVFLPKAMLSEPNYLDGIDRDVDLYFCDFPEYEFALFHNEFYRDKQPDQNISNACAVGKEVGPILQLSEVDPTVVIAEGLHISIGPDNKRIQLKHMGNVVIEEGCRVGPLTFIQRATLPGCSTIIKKGALVDGYCTIGHNAVIGENSLVAAGSIVGAGTVIGKNCLIGIQTAIKPHTVIADHVVTGIGSVVTRDLLKPGIYYGNPAVFVKENSPDWMW